MATNVYFATLVENAERKEEKFTLPCSLKLDYPPEGGPREYSITRHYHKAQAGRVLTLHLVIKSDHMMKIYFNATDRNGKTHFKGYGGLIAGNNDLYFKIPDCKEFSILFPEDYNVYPENTLYISKFTIK